MAVTSSSPLASTAPQPQTTYEYVRPWLYQKQQDAIFCPERYAIIENAGDWRPAQQVSPSGN